MKKTTVLIDGFWCTKPRGLGKYIRTLVRAIAEFSDEKQFEFYLALPQGSEIPEFLIGSKIKVVRGWNFPYPLWEQLIIPFLCRINSVDILHSPCNTYPFLKAARHQIVTLHDLIFLDQAGENLYQRIGNLYRAFLARVMKIKKSYLSVVTDSIASARLIQECIGLNARPIYIPVEFAVDAPVAEKNKENKGHVVHIGGTSPHKNTRLVIEAFKKSNQAVPLVVLGLPRDCDLAREFESDQIRFPGWISDTGVYEIISTAKFLIFPSLAEGFGLPIIEAFALGTPVITSNIDPMREISGKASLLIDPRSMEQMVNAINLLGDDFQVRDELRQLGFQRVADFSLQSFAAKMLQVYSRRA